MREFQNNDLIMLSIPSPKTILQRPISRRCTAVTVQAVACHLRARFSLMIKNYKDHTDACHGPSVCFFKKKMFGAVKLRFRKNLKYFK